MKWSDGCELEKVNGFRKFMSLWKTSIFRLRMERCCSTHAKMTLCKFCYGCGTNLLRSVASKHQIFLAHIHQLDIWVFKERDLFKCFYTWDSITHCLNYVVKQSRRWHFISTTAPARRQIVSKILNSRSFYRFFHARQKSSSSFMPGQSIESEREREK